MTPGLHRSRRLTLCHRCRKMSDTEWRISWVTYFYIGAGSGIKKRKEYFRYTDRRGAKRFCKKYKLEFEKYVL